MASRLGILLLLLSLTSTIQAEDNCGSMMRTAARFRGTIRSIEQLAGQEDITPVDFDMSFVVSVDVESVETTSLALQPGQRRNFGIHSPARTFGAGNIAGSTVDIEAELMACDGRFRRFVNLRTLPPKRLIEYFDGSLEIGHSYRAEVIRESSSELTFVKRLYLPMHHDVGVDWTNIDHFPELTRKGPPRNVLFEVTSVRIQQLAERRWLSMYQLKLIQEEE